MSWWRQCEGKAVCKLCNDLCHDGEVHTEFCLFFGLCGLGIWFLFVVIGRPLGLWGGCLPLLVDLGVALFSLCGVGLGLRLLWALGFAILVLFGVGLRLLLAVGGRVCFLGRPLGFDRCLSWYEAVEFAEEDS